MDGNLAMANALENTREPEDYIISTDDYITNKQKCFCGCKSFFSWSDMNNLITIKLECKDCDTVYLRDLNDVTKGFIQQLK